MKVVIIVEARMGATRLPGKTLAKIVGKPMLELILERLKRVKKADDLVIATTVNKKDDQIVELCKRLNVKYFRGSEEDVMDRVLKAAKENNAELIVEAYGDTPFVDPEIVDEVIDYFLKNDYDYVSINIPITFPLGFVVRLFTTKGLEEIEAKTKDPVDRENVSNYFYEHPETYKIGNVRAPTKELTRPDLRLTVDIKEDLEIARKVYEHLYHKNPNFSALDVIKTVDKLGLKNVDLH